MGIRVSPEAISDLKYWQKSGDKAVRKKIQQLLTSITDTPFSGIGKPEQLKHEHTWKWSRRIDREHRIVYMVDDDEIKIFSLRGHYK